MSVLVIIETQGQELKKGAFELATYGKKTADLLNSNCKALVLGDTINAEDLGIYGAYEIHQVKDNSDAFDARSYVKVIVEAAESLTAHTIILRHNANGKG